MNGVTLKPPRAQNTSPWINHVWGLYFVKLYQYKGMGLGISRFTTNELYFKLNGLGKWGLQKILPGGKTEYLDIHSENEIYIFFFSYVRECPIDLSLQPTQTY